VNALVEVPMMLAFPALARRVRVQPLIVVGAVAFGLRATGWAIAGSAEAAVAVALLGGFGFALFLVGTTSHVAARAPAGTQATAQGLFAGTAFALGSILGALLGGVVAGALGLAAVNVAAAATAFLGAGIVWVALVGRAAPTQAAPVVPASQPLAER
jgi:MFS family permease